MNSDYSQLINKTQVKRSLVCWLFGTRGMCSHRGFILSNFLNFQTSSWGPIPPSGFWNSAFLLYCIVLVGRKTDSIVQIQLNPKPIQFIQSLPCLPRMYRLLCFPKDGFLSPKSPSARRNHSLFEPSVHLIYPLISFYLISKYLRTGVIQCLFLYFPYGSSKSWISQVLSNCMWNDAQ